MSKKFDAKSIQEKLDGLYKGVDLTSKAQDDNAILSRERAGLAYKEKYNTDEEFRLRRNDALRAAHRTPEYLKKIKKLNKDRAEDPNWRQMMDQKNKKMAEDPAWVEAHAKAAAARKTDDEWLAKVRENGKKLKKNKKWKKNVTAANIKKASDPEFQAKRLPKYTESYQSDASEYTRKRCKPMKTKFGIFFKVSEVIKYIKENNINHPTYPSTLRGYINDPNMLDWQYITWEEYDELTKPHV